MKDIKHLIALKIICVFSLLCFFLVFLVYFVKYGAILFLIPMTHFNKLKFFWKLCVLIIINNHYLLLLKYFINNILYCSNFRLLQFIAIYRKHNFKWGKQYLRRGSKEDIEGLFLPLTVFSPTIRLLITFQRIIDYEGGSYSFLSTPFPKLGILEFFSKYLNLYFINGEIRGMRAKGREW